MSCSQCKGIEDLFNQETVAKELSQYRKKGSSKTTSILIQALKAKGVQGLSLVDVGGGVGAIQHGLLAAGVRSATDVDASQAYIDAAREEALRLGFSDRVRFYHGNFIDLAVQVSPADIVTLDRVICCYPDMENLVQLTSARAGKYYGLVYPRDAWWIKIGIRVMNVLLQLRKNPFRLFAHPTQKVDALLQSGGFKKSFAYHTFIWQVAVFSR